MANPPTIFSADGVTPLRQAMNTEIAGPSMMTGRSVATGNPSAGLTPERLAAILRAAEDGNIIDYLELAEAIEEKYLHYLGVLGTRKRQVSQLPVSVEAASDDPLDQAKADLIRDWLRRDTLEPELFDMLDAVGKGYSVTEIVWKLGADRWLPEKLLWRDPRWFEPDRLDGTTLRLRGAGAPQPLQLYKFVVHVHSAKSGLPIRGGLAKPVAWAWLFQSFALKDWVSFADIYGFPVRLGKYQPGSTEDQIRKLMQAVANVSHDAAAVIPNTMELEFISAQAGSTADVFQQLAEYLDKQVSKAVLGQTGTTDGESGRLGGGAGREHGEVRADIERADAKLLAASLNAQLVRPIIDLNFGASGGNYPMITIGREDDEEEFDTWLGGVERFVDRGGRVAQSVVRDRLGIEDPGADEALLSPLSATPAQNAPLDASPAPAATNPPKTPLPGLSRPLKPLTGALSDAAAAPITAAAADLTGAQLEGDDIQAAAVALVDAEWEEMMAPMIAPLMDAIMAAGSYEETADAMMRALPRMDVTTLAERLERAAFAARALALTGADRSQVEAEDAEAESGAGGQ